MNVEEGSHQRCIRIPMTACKGNCSVTAITASEDIGIPRPTSEKRIPDVLRRHNGVDNATHNGSRPDSRFLGERCAHEQFCLCAEKEKRTQLVSRPIIDATS